MSILEETTRDVSSLPDDGSGLTSAHWMLIANIERRFDTELRVVADSLRRFETVSELSRQIEKEWYRAAIAHAEELLAAVAFYEEWWESARVDSVDKPAADARRQTHRRWAKFEKAVRLIGDPTAPAWKPPRRYRLHTYGKTGRWK
jgi:hypothetical protein